MKMKASLLAAAMLLGITPMTAYAETTAETAVEEETVTAAEDSEKLITEDGFFSYKLDEDGNARVYNFNMRGYQGEVEIPSEIDGHPVTHISNACFLNAFSLSSVVIPETVETIGDSLFFGCSSLESIRVAEENTHFIGAEDGTLRSADGSILYCYPAGKTEESYTIPDTVTEIAPSCFAYAQNLKTIAIPDGIEYIPGWCFAYSALERVTMADSVLELDDYAFAYCEKLAEADLGEGMTTIYNAVFANCSALTEITLPESLTAVGQYAFAGTGMKEVTIPRSVTEIEYCAFGYNENLFPISDFVIRGYANSIAQSYAGAVDEDNDYKNEFTFLTIEEENIPVPSEFADKPSTQESAESAQDAPAAVKAGVNRFAVILGICGGAVVILAGVLIALLVKKPKKPNTKENEDEA